MVLNNKDKVKKLLDATYLLAKNYTNNIESKLWMYQFCASSFWHNYSGTFVHYQLEEDLISISNEIIDCELDINFENNHVLHIMTEAYDTGGHTRVVENWIKSTSHIHSVFLNNPFSSKPSFLVEAVAAKKGSIIINDKNGFVEKAKFLAQIASGFKYVVLHHHPHDILPLLSFGTKKFSRPIFFYNHADHVWGCGYSISDYLIEICEQGVQHSIKYRGIPENKVISAGIPISLPKKSKWIANKENKYIISMASAYKFSPIENLSFQNFIDKILYTESNVEYYAIGVSPSDEYWQILQSKYPSRIHLKGILKKEDAHSLIQKATLYIDSFPLGSSTSLLEAISLGIPVLSYASPIQHMDSYRQYSYNNIDELFNEAIRILNLSNDERYEIAIDAWNSINLWHSQESFSQRIEKLECIVKHCPIQLTKTVVKDNYLGIYTDFLYKLLLQNNFKFDYYLIRELPYSQRKDILKIINSFNLLEYTIPLLGNKDLIDAVSNHSELFLQLYFDESKGFSEENSVILPVLENKEIQRFEFDLKGKKDIKSLRLDPLNDSCVIKIEKLYLLQKDGGKINLIDSIRANICYSYEGSYFFENFDPQIYFENFDLELLNSVEKLCIEFRYNYISKEALHICYNQITTNKNNKIFILENEKMEFQESLSSLNNELALIYNSKSWKIMQVFKKIAKKIISLIKR